jgi:hypothetical protein
MKATKKKYHFLRRRHPSGKRAVIMRRRKKTEPIKHEEGTPLSFPFERGGHRMLIFGASQTGKTSALIKILKEFRRKYGKEIEILILSPHLTTDKTWKKHRKKRGQLGLYDEHFEKPTDNVLRLIDRKLRLRGKWLTTRRGKKPKPLVLAIDDLGDNTTLKLSRKINVNRDLAMKAPHTMTVVIKMCHRMSHAITEEVDNAEYALLTRFYDLEQIEKFRKKFLGHLTKKQFENVIEDVYGDGCEYPCLYVSRAGHGAPKVFKGLFKPVDITPRMDQ